MAPEHVASTLQRHKLKLLAGTSERRPELLPSQKPLKQAELRDLASSQQCLCKICHSLLDFPQTGRGAIPSRAAVVDCIDVASPRPYAGNAQYLCARCNFMKNLITDIQRHHTKDLMTLQSASDAAEIAFALPAADVPAVERICSQLGLELLLDTGSFSNPKRPLNVPFSRQHTRWRNWVVRLSDLAPSVGVQISNQALQHEQKMLDQPGAALQG